MSQKSLDRVLPHFTVSVLPYDPATKEALVMWRGENVRSAKNCLAIPSGLLEHGESFPDALARELAEELGLGGELLGEFEFRALYRNQPGDGFDWVIGIWTVGVLELRENARNMEPDKHSWIEFLHLDDLASLVKVGSLWGGGLAEALDPVVQRLRVSTL